MNDAYGHRRGDQALCACVQRIQTEIRSSDLLFRYGGDEFVILLPNAPTAAAIALAHRVIEAVQATPLMGEPPLTVTLSIGVASFPDEAVTADQLFDKADQRAYEAKRRGRAQVVGDDSGAAEITLREPSRLVEREAALDLLHHFFEQLTEQSHGFLTLNGPSGTGRTGFLDAVERAAQMRGYGVRRLRGQRALQRRPLWLGQIAWAQGEREAAQAHFTASLTLGRALDNTEVIVTSLLGLGWIDLAQEAFMQAVTCFEESRVLSQRSALQGGLAASLRSLGWVPWARGQAGTAVQYFQEGLRIWTVLGDRPGIAGGIEGLAAVIGAGVADEELWQATRLLGAATALRAAVGVPLPPPERATYEALIVRMRARAGETRWATVWAEGQALPVEQALAIAFASGPDAAQRGQEL